MVLPVSVSFTDAEVTSSTHYMQIGITSQSQLELLNELNIEIIENYDSFVLAKVTDNMKDLFSRMNMEVSPINDRTMIGLKSYSFDTSVGEPDLADNLKIYDYAPGTEGTYILQFIGPVKAQWLEDIRGLGIDFYDYIPNHAYIVRATNEEISAAQNLHIVEWSGIYQPAYKMAPDMHSGETKIQIWDGPDTMDTISTIFANYGVMDYSYNEPYQKHEIIIDADVASIPDIAQFSDVIWINQIDENALCDEVDSEITGGIWTADTPYGGFGSYANHLGWDGSGVIVAVADTGLSDGTVGDAGHLDFENRVVGGVDYTASGYWADGYGHGTHCAGIVAANGSAGTGTKYGSTNYYVGAGVAPDAELFAQKIFTDAGSGTGIPTDQAGWDTLFQDAYDAGVYVHSNSWGERADLADSIYEDNDIYYDQHVRDVAASTAGQQPMVITTSAGNGGNYGTQTIGSPGSGKNVITVGATETYHPDASSYQTGQSSTYSSTDADNPDQVPSFSAKGLEQDTRIKPDIVAPGEAILSTHTTNNPVDMYYGLYTPDTRYEWSSGTSMSTPNVAGALAVIVEWYTATYGTAPMPAMVKSLLINAAIDVGTLDIPNGNEGWGRAYLPPIVDPPVDVIQMDNPQLLSTGQTFSKDISYQSGAEPLKITLVWTDAPGASLANPALVNDLNLRITAPGGQIWYGNSFTNGMSTPDTAARNTNIAGESWDNNGDNYDDRNNVECVYIPTGQLQSGIYTIDIIAQNVPTDVIDGGAVDQDFALVIYNAVDVSSAGTIELDRTLYAIEDSVTITVSDIDLNTLPGSPQNVDVDIDSDTEFGVETVTLIETGDDTSVFTGSITISATNGVGTLEVAQGDIITATYDDANDGTGPATVTDTAIVDGGVEPPTGLTVTWDGTSSSTLIDEDWSGGYPAAGWGEIDPTDDWTSTTTSVAGGASPEAHFTWFNGIDTWTIYAGPMDTTGMSNLDLSFRQYFDDYDTGVTVKVQTSNDGSSWIDAGWEIISNGVQDASDGPTQPAIVLNDANVGSGTFYVGWTVDGNAFQLDNWYVDDVLLTYTGGATTEDNRLDWTLSADDGAGANDVDHYNIYRADTPIVGAYLDNVPAGTDTYTDSGAGEFDGTNWWYVVRAVDTATNEDNNVNAVPEIASSNNPPNAPINPVPADLATGIATSPTLSVDVSDPDSDTMTVRFYDASDDSQIDFQNNVISGGTSSISWNGLSESTTYSWYATAYDGEFTAQSATWSFTTLDSTAPASPTGLTVEHYGTAAGSSTYTYNGVTSPSGTHIAFYYDVHDMTGPGPNPQSGPFEASTVDYGEISSSNNIRWTTSDPGNGDEAFVWSNISVAESPATITQIDMTFEGQCVLATDYQIWAYNQVTTTWGQIGVADSASAGIDLTITESITTNCADYISVEGTLCWGIYQTTPNEPISIDYLEAVIQYSGGGGLDDNAVNWTASADDGAGDDDVDYYNIYRSDIEGGPWDIPHRIDTVPATGAATYSYIDTLKGQADVPFWWYVVRAVDLSTNEDGNSVAVEEPNIIAPAGYDIPIPSLGWVFVSFPFVMSGDIATVLTDSDGTTEWDIAKWYDPQDANNPWKTYSVNNPGLNDMPVVTNNMGMWLHITVNDGILTTGTVGDYSASPVDITLYPGWNIVGYPSATGENAFDSLLGLGVNWIAEYQETSPFVADYSDLTQVDMSEGNAYWVHVDALTVWTVNP